MPWGPVMDAMPPMERPRDLLHEWVYHDRNHVQPILQNVKLLMWPEMGNTRRFSTVGADGE